MGHSTQHMKQTKKNGDFRPIIRTIVGCTPRGSCNNTLLRRVFRRVLRRFSNNKRFSEGFLEGTCMGFSAKTRFL